MFQVFRLFLTCSRTVDITFFQFQLHLQLTEATLGRSTRSLPIFVLATMHQAGDSFQRRLTYSIWKRDKAIELATDGRPATAR